MLFFPDFTASNNKVWSDLQGRIKPWFKKPGNLAPIFLYG